MKVRSIYCCGCEKAVNAHLTNGGEIYPHRQDLSDIPFWACGTCKNYVGCHHKSSNRTRPLGNIPTKELRNARGHIHKILDPIWKQKKMSRNKVYAKLSEHIGREYHTAEISNINEAKKVYKFVLKLSKELK